MEYQLLISELDDGFLEGPDGLWKIMTQTTNFNSDILTSKAKAVQQSTAACHAILDKAAQIKAIDSSQRIFLARDCVDWNV